MSSEWGYVTFAEAPFEIIDGDRGANYPKQHEFTNSGYCLFLNAGNVTSDGFSFSDCAFISKEKDGLLRKGKLQREDIVLTTRGTVGNIAHYAQHVTCPEMRINSGMVILRPDTAKILPRYLYLFLRSGLFKRQVAFLRSGSAQPQLPIRDMNRIEIPLPSVALQKEIVSVLGAIDDRITLLRETNATLEAIAQALFKSWFVDFDPVRAKIEGRAPEGMDEATAALFPDSFEELEWGAVPRGWRVGAFSDVCDIASGKRPPDRSDSAEVGNETPLYGGAGIMGYTSMPLFDDRKILTGRVGTLGKVHIAYPPFWASDNVLVITPKDQSCFSLVLHWLRTIDVLALNRGSTQPLLTQRDLGAQRGVIPPSHVVAEFEEVVEPLYQRIQEQEVQVQTLASLRDTLLPRLISGQLSLLDAESTISEAQV